MSIYFHVGCVYGRARVTRCSCTPYGKLKPLEFLLQPYLPFWGLRGAEVGRIFVYVFSNRWERPLPLFPSQLAAKK